jgi:hypothetical protein
MPKSVVRLAGREDMSDETQALCFLAGANSIFYGPKLLTTRKLMTRSRPALMDPLRQPAPDGVTQANMAHQREPRVNKPPIDSAPDSHDIKRDFQGALEPLAAPAVRAMRYRISQNAEKVV